MNIVVAVRCRNEIKNVKRFLDRYDFADIIIVSDGGSTDGSYEYLELVDNPKVRVFQFKHEETFEAETWNPDHTHINFVINTAKEYRPDWLIFDDMDSTPTLALKHQARRLLEECQSPQVNAFRLYLWGEDAYFPHMNRYFNTDYTSLWAWRPDQLDIRADPTVRHGTMIGLSTDICHLDIPYCLLHRSWHPDTIDAKIARYNALGLPMEHPLKFAGQPEALPEWAL